jgi:putative membrane protein
MSPSRLTDPKVFGSLVAIATAFSLAGCKKSETPATDTATTAVAPARDTTPPAAAAAPAINDAQIAHIAVTANAVDSAAGELAKKKGSTKAVKGFGQSILTKLGVHSRLQAVALVTKLNGTPEDNETSKQLKAGGDANLAKLETLTGAAFDKAYIDNEVAYHQAVLDAIDKTLIPNSKNAELKGLLEKVRPAVAAHLEHAKTIQSGMTKTGA